MLSFYFHISFFSQFQNGSETPRGSWASFDLRNSQPDAPIVGLLESWDADTVDRNELTSHQKQKKKKNT